MRIRAALSTRLTAASTWRTRAARERSSTAARPGAQRAAPQVDIDRHRRDHRRQADYITREERNYSVLERFGRPSDVVLRRRLAAEG
jgi:hypothetical protein